MPEHLTVFNLFNAFSPASFVLTGEKVHLWQVLLSQSDSLRSELFALLNQDERDRAARFYFERDRERYIIGRGFLRLLIGQYLQIDPGQIGFTYSEFGKPALDAVHRSQLDFNLAHSADRAVYVFTSGCRVGIDLEFVRQMPDEDHFAAMYFSQREGLLLQGLSAQEKTAAFFKLWTAKESYLKAVGAGLAGELNQVEVELLPQGGGRFLSLGGDPAAAQRWRLELFTPWENFQAALALDVSDKKLSIHNLTGESH